MTATASLTDVHPIVVTDANFAAEVLAADLPVLVDFWGEWCPPCKAIAPAIDAIAQEHADKLKVGKLDADTDIVIAAHYNVQGLPTLLLFKGGREVERIVGNMPKDRIVARLLPHLA